MKVLRRTLGVIVMIAGILGLVLSLAGLIMVWVVKPTIAVYANSTIATLNQSVSTSQSVMEITGQALGATIDSVDALSAMLSTTAATIEDTRPVLDGIDTILAETLPATLGATTDSLNSAQGAARVLESAIQSLEAFRSLLSNAPLIGGMVGQTEETYKPEKPLADSLGELASNLETLPDTFIEMSVNLSSSGDNLESIQENLVTMSDSVKLISSSLSEYERMINQSQSSMDNLTSILTNIQNNLAGILNVVGIALSMFFVWLLVAQIVILSQGWELYHGTTGRMESDAQ